MNPKFSIEDKLIDNINIDESLFDKEDMVLDEYSYKGKNFGDLKIRDVLQESYIAKFATYLADLQGKRMLKFEASFN